MRTHPEITAARVLKELKVNSVEDLYHLEELIWYRGAFVRYDKLDGSEARLSTVGRRAIITISTAIQNQPRLRFSIGHELGHLEMHRYDGLLAICTGRDLDEWRSKKGEHNLEHEANEFASAFLIPQPLFEPLCDEEAPSLDFISELASRFRTSLTATALRYTRFCSEPVAIVYSQEGRVIWFRGSAALGDLSLYLETTVRLDPLSNAALVAIGKGSNIARRVPVDAWFAKGAHHADAEIIEHSWLMPSCNAVLTLLWTDAELFSADDNFLWL